MLTVPDLEFPANYDGRLQVRLTSTTGAVLSSFIYDGSDLNANGEIDITSQIDGLNEGLYIFELRMLCGSNFINCPGNLPNRVKKTYIRIVLDNFKAVYRYSAQGAFGTNCAFTGILGDDPLGPIIDLDPSCNPIYEILITDIENAGGEGISGTLLERECDSGDISVVGSFEVDAETVASGNVNLGGFTNYPTTGCRCYILSVRFFDICINDINNTEVYWRIGPDCEDDIVGPGGPGSEQSKASFSAENGPFQIYPNPVENDISIQW